jgi:hypothetical protein
MSQPFVKIDGRQLQLKANLNFPALGAVKVVSILGKARMGKSSFLNCIASHLTKTNKKIFSSLGGFDHITKGIDYYHMPDQNLLLLDSQGLAYEDCSHDPMLLLFVYLVSDVIVFNERMMLQNEALKLLEPVCAFLNVIDIEDIVKPTLFFRISDGDMLGSEPQKNLDKVLAEYQDQYQSIRNSIRHLFHDPIGIVKTNQLDKAAKAYIDAGTFKPLLSDTENGFGDAIDAILSACRRTEKNKNITNLPHIIDQINNKDKIDISKLDVVYLQHDKTISTWIQEIPKENYYPISVTGTQKSFDEQVVPRQNVKKALLTAFTKKFKTVSDEIKSAYYQKLNQDLTTPIELAKTSSERAAEERIKAKMSVALKDRAFERITNYSSSFTATATDGFILQYLRYVGELEFACQDVYEPIKQKYTEMCKVVNNSFIAALNTAKAEEAKDLVKVNEYVSDVLRTFIEDATKDIQSLTADCAKPNSHILDVLHNKTVLKVKLDMQNLCRDHEVTGEMKNSVGTFRHDSFLKRDYSWVGKTVENYDLTKEPFARFLSGLENLKAQLDAILTTHKKKFLFGKIWVNGRHGFSAGKDLVISLNPQIKFVANELVNMTMSYTRDYFMTEETYNALYKPIIVSAIEKLVEKGVVKMDNMRSHTVEEANLSKITVVCEGLNDQRYEANVLELLEHKVKKLYCKEIVKGTQFGEELSF